ncbi:MAG: HAMP domain-containing sensor histidine kinase, partial [bacterium]|nr:HAMP domain-containing sensor histidine kinase [bacterium]
GADMALTLISEREQDDSLKSLVSTTQESIRSTKGIVSLLEDFSQKNREGYRWIILADCLEEVTRIFALSPEASRVTVHRACAAASRAFCDPQQIKLALFNLLRNSLQSGAKNVWLKGGGENGEIEISVRDDGSGIPKEIQSKIFEPFYTTKDVGQGVGLGLWMVYRTIKEHGGVIDLQSQPGFGSEFRLTLPCQPQVVI